MKEMIKLNSSKVGTLSLMKFVTRCLELEWSVSLPVGDKERYDCILNKGNGFERVQVKTGRLKKSGIIVFRVANNLYHSKNEPFYRKDYHGDVEQFGVYCPETHKCYMVPMNSIPTSGACMRIDKPKNNQNKRIRWAKDYEI